MRFESVPKGSCIGSLFINMVVLGSGETFEMIGLMEGA
jgi:hypothetical protein